MKRIRIDKWLVILVVIALSTLSWWMPLEQESVIALATAPEKRHIVDYDLTDFDVTTMNAAGYPRSHLQGRTMRHYADDDTADVVLPQLTLFRPGATPWFVRSEQAHVTAGAKIVFFRDRVKVDRLTSDEDDKLEILTDALMVLPSEEYAESNLPVTIVTAQGMTHGVGMQASFEQQQFELLTQVRGQYAGQ